MDPFKLVFLLALAEAKLLLTAAVVGRFKPLVDPGAGLIISLLVVGVLRLLSSFLTTLAVIGVVFTLRFGVCSAAPFLSATTLGATAVEGLEIPNTFFGAGVLGGMI
jgi:hypothetical protein